MELRANPFLDRGQWYWRDENQQCFGPFPDQLSALRELIRALDKRSRWAKLKEALGEFMA